MVRQSLSEDGRPWVIPVFHQISKSKSYAKDQLLCNLKKQNEKGKGKQTGVVSPTRRENIMSKYPLMRKFRSFCHSFSQLCSIKKKAY